MSAPKKNWTLRDIRRILGKSQRDYWDFYIKYPLLKASYTSYEEAMGWMKFSGIDFPEEYSVHESIPVFDRLISQYGPNAVLEKVKKEEKEEEKPSACKGSRQPESQDDSQSADKNESPEEDHARKDGHGAEPRGGGRPSSSGSQEGKDSNGAVNERVGDSNPTEGSGAEPGDTPTRHDGDDPTPRGSAGAEAVMDSVDGRVAHPMPSAHGREEGQNRTEEAPSPVWNRPGEDDAQANNGSDVDSNAETTDAHGTSAPPSPTRSGQWGGRYVDQDYRLPPHDRRGTKEIIRLLRRIITAAETGLGIDTSPRIAGKKLVRELVSRRVNITRARRDELDMPIVLILADVSGSCSAVSNETLAAAVELSRLDERVVAIEHSNGVPITVYTNGRAESFEGYIDAEEWWEKYIFHRRIGAVVAFGDEDAFEIYRILSQSAPFIWLDSYTASLGTVRDLTKRMREHIPVAAYMVGVNNASTAAIALRMAEKKKIRRRT